MKPDPTKTKGWQIAHEAEKRMKSLESLANELGLQYGELLPMGHQLAKLDQKKIRRRLASTPEAKYIDVTAITPTPLGEGKTTTTIGLVQGLGKLKKKVIGTIRQSSAGPTFNIKGAGAGGGLAQAIPITPLCIRLTGDIEAITNAHNLAMTALTARMQHEHNYDDATLAKRNLKRLDIDPGKVQWKWVLDFCAQSLRNITIGQGGPKDGLEMQSGAQITASSELMAILSVATDLEDLRERVSKIVLAYDRNGNKVTTADLEVDGAMTAWLVDALNPNLVQTLEGQPMLVHAGPFANIAIGQNSIIADKTASKLADYVVTESGFGADIGFEKFWNLKCRMSGLKPDAVVIVATIRALKMHGGGPAVKPGKALDSTYTEENTDLVARGCENLIAHIETVKKSGIKPVVCLNHYYTDTEAEIEVVRRAAGENGALFSVSKHWLEGGDGAMNLAETVLEACEAPNEFDYLYPDETPFRKRIETIATQLYGAADVEYEPAAIEKFEKLEADPYYKDFGLCMVKTHLSLSHDPSLKNRPAGWTLPIRDIYVYEGARLVVPLAGGIKLMPGTGSDPAYRRIDVDTETGEVYGIG
ncbi:Formate--tetrahydrofolate ligase [Anaerohalosphaera lusitana]|uniref:Formate--tetrahydrofolate ligase n=1 Tax=Anaerohalosphaera lusitana TaxID=1936003 RepID=A0A1U9NNL2_9BACT|nr:formate--tetrahydrofolate ligase [Anaerohalosphaera lusitana]AQT69511.1 Formate--tetrahydrofolate ligase [Anaerohalosphaera lusitana]